MNDLGTLVGALLTGIALYGLIRLCTYTYYIIVSWLETDEQ